MFWFKCINEFLIGVQIGLVIIATATNDWSSLFYALGVLALNLMLYWGVVTHHED